MTLYHGDNLPILKAMDTATIDLIYLDPPFATERDWGAFDDRWIWEGADMELPAIAGLYAIIGPSPMLAYLVMMAARLVELHRVLKPTGSLYLHCDPTASHYLKIMLDSIFGPEQFRNEIIWRRTGAHAARRSFGPIHDTILFYTKTDDYFFRITKRPYMRKHVDGRYKQDDSGQYKFSSGGNVLTGPGATNGESGQVWRGFNPSAKNRHWAVPGFLTQQMAPEFMALGVLDKLDALYEKGLIEINAGSAWPTPVRYLGADDGLQLQDIWSYQPYTEGTVFGTADGIDADVAWLGPTAPERLGYQTQKPLGLLERIIHSSCPDNGLVLDPFCGCGTAVAAAEKLGRRWIGIDIGEQAIALTTKRVSLQTTMEETRACYSSSWSTSNSNRHRE